MSSKIEPRPYRIGTGNLADPENLEELETRRAKHARMTAKKPERTFGEVLKARQVSDWGEKEEEERQEHGEGAIDPHMGLAPQQDASLVTGGQGRRSAKVIVKG